MGDETHNNAHQPSRLTPTEREVARQLATRGPLSLYDAGWTEDQVMEFHNRPEVQRYIEFVEAEYSNAPAIKSRVQFDGIRQLAGLGHKSIDVLEQTLQGPEYQRGPNGEVLYEGGKPVVIDPAPTKEQSRVARDVLDRLGIDRSIELQHESLRELFESTERSTSEMDVEVDQDNPILSQEDQVTSRERIRKAMEVIMLDLPELRDKTQKQLTGSKKQVNKNRRNRRSNLRQSTRGRKKKKGDNESGGSGEQ